MRAVNTSRTGLSQAVLKPLDSSPQRAVEPILPESPRSLNRRAETLLAVNWRSKYLRSGDYWGLLVHIGELDILIQEFAQHIHHSTLEKSMLPWEIRSCLKALKAEVHWSKLTPLKSLNAYLAWQEVIPRHRSLISC